VSVCCLSGVDSPDAAATKTATRTMEESIRALRGLSGDQADQSVCLFICWMQTTHMNTRTGWPKAEFCQWNRARMPGEEMAVCEVDVGRDA
jgi:hypothetical protein